MIEVVVKHGMIRKDLLLLGVVVGVTGAVTQEIIQAIKTIQKNDDKDNKDNSDLLLLVKNK